MMHEPQCGVPVHGHNRDFGALQSQQNCAFSPARGVVGSEAMIRAAPRKNAKDDASIRP